LTLSTTLSGCDGESVFGIIIILLIIGYIANEKIIKCKYCGRDVKRKNLKDGMCPFCGNQVE
jgi:hypothetical protein